METQDRFGKKVSARSPIQVLNPKAGKLAIKIPHLIKAPTWTVEPGGEFMAIWGSGYSEARAFIEVEHRRKILQSFWTERGLTQLQLKQVVNEAMRGGFTVHVTMVRENRAYLSSHKVNVPWTNKNLTVNGSPSGINYNRANRRNGKPLSAVRTLRKRSPKWLLYSTTKASTNSKLTNGNKLLECSARTTTA